MRRKELFICTLGLFILASSCSKRKAGENDLVGEWRITQITQEYRLDNTDGGYYGIDTDFNDGLAHIKWNLLEYDSSGAVWWDSSVVHNFDQTLKIEKDGSLSSVYSINSTSGTQSGSWGYERVNNVIRRFIPIMSPDLTPTYNWFPRWYKHFNIVYASDNELKLDIYEWEENPSVKSYISFVKIAD
jgi:hypothetical protein